MPSFQQPPFVYLITALIQKRKLRGKDKLRQIILYRAADSIPSSAT